MSEKECFKCKQTQSLTNFYKHKRMADGRLGKCKQCAKIDSTKHRKKNLAKIRRYDRDRAKTPGVRARISRVSREWRAKHPDRYRAQNILNNAVRDNKISKPAQCSRCGKRNAQVEGHHSDYSKPLKVIWACSICHYKLDEERRMQELA